MVATLGTRPGFAVKPSPHPAKIYRWVQGKNICRSARSCLIVQVTANSDNPDANTEQVAQELPMEISEEPATSNEATQ